MKFTGRTWRPHYEADSCIIELTSGCTYNKCNFCNLYQNEPFCLTPLSEFEKRLEEIKSYQPNARRILALLSMDVFQYHGNYLHLIARCNGEDNPVKGTVHC